MAEFLTKCALHLDLESGNTAYCHASLIDLYLHTKFHGNQRNFLWTDGRTDGRTFETHFIRSTRRNRPNKQICIAPFGRNFRSAGTRQRVSEQREDRKPGRRGMSLA